jgi:hypothetical protein
VILLVDVPTLREQGAAQARRSGAKERRDRRERASAPEGGGNMILLVDAPALREQGAAQARRSGAKERRDRRERALAPEGGAA